MEDLRKFDFNITDEEIEEFVARHEGKPIILGGWCSTAHGSYSDGRAYHHTRDQCYVCQRSDAFIKKYMEYIKRKAQ